MPAVKPPFDSFTFICESICGNVRIVHDLLFTIKRQRYCFTCKIGHMKYDGIQVSSVGVERDGGLAVIEAAFIRGSTTLHTSTVRSGLRLLLNSAHLKPICASWLACTKGQLPAFVSMMECRFSFSMASSTISAILCGCFPVRRRKIIMPKEYTSDLGVSSPVVRNSGSIYEKVPLGFVVR